MKELRWEGILYFEMKDGETEEEAIKRLEKLFDDAKICVSGEAETEVVEY